MTKELKKFKACEVEAGVAGVRHYFKSGTHIKTIMELMNFASGKLVYDEDFECFGVYVNPYYFNSVDTKRFLEYHNGKRVGDYCRVGSIAQNTSGFSGLSIHKGNTIVKKMKELSKKLDKMEIEIMFKRKFVYSDAVLIFEIQDVRYEKEEEFAFNVKPNGDLQVDGKLTMSGDTITWGNSNLKSVDYNGTTATISGLDAHTHVYDCHPSQPQVGKRVGYPDIDIDIKAIKNETKNINVKENDSMKNLMGNMVMGKAGSKYKLSMNGVAVKTNDGYVAFDPNSNSMIDVPAEFVFDFDALYIFPDKDIKKGDTILYNNNTIYVTEVLKNSVKGYAIETQTVIEVLPKKNIFGFNFYSKIFNFMGNGFMNGEGMNPMMMMFLMKDGGNMFGGNGGMMEMMMMSQMFGGEMKNPFMNMFGATKKEEVKED